ncbi:MAG: 4-hydroxythreonine-4-phosphate dehydrogenase (EC [uncultured Aureispira sp.]|uniref:4-hydroxythreonine-4-phosphate dehydrogenase (EC) n=1 Tax=uncultured Aureispira sp. TaxID=1331704 RepID=A0A6S6T7B4_9BACT|nr:MAG: 4-hydroxythreonine-4-phosphate dehydrogenase (EC [uncultured Aureispira sp.]
MTNKKLKIGISIGDINGIGLEVILKTLADKRILDWCTPVLYGSTKVASYHKNIIKVKDLTLHNITDIHGLNESAVNVINCWMENVKITLGKCTAEGGKYAAFSLEQATEDLLAGHLDALVTAPINKKAMQLSGFEYPGHTEYLTYKSQVKENLMLMVNEGLRVGLVTNHIPVAQVASTITTELVLKKIELMNNSLKMDFGIDKPAIAVLGLNPHAGDGGVLGSEEIDIILPAIELAKRKGILAIGPYAADGLFGSGNFANFDGILAMYHDQGLVPFKALSFGAGVNFTAGLPIIRTSPDHGTGFDIAGSNTADFSSFRQALYLAMDSAKQRAEYLEMTGNPLKTVVVNEMDSSPEDIVDNDGVAPEDQKRAGKKRGKREREQKPKRGREQQDSASAKEKTPRTKKETPKVTEEAQRTKKEAPKAKEKSPSVEETPKKNKKPLTVEERLALAAKKKQKAVQNKEVVGTEKVSATTIEETTNTDAIVEEAISTEPKVEEVLIKEAAPVTASEVTEPMTEENTAVLESNKTETTEPIAALTNDSEEIKEEETPKETEE